MQRIALSTDEYWSLAQLIETEIANAILIHYTYEEIHRLARRDEHVLRVLNKNILFWQTQLHCLQTTLFMTLSRIFDTSQNQASTVHSLLAATSGNLAIFSRDAPYDRTVKAGLTPPLLDDYMATIWIPTCPAELRHLKAALKPYTKRF